MKNFIFSLIDLCVSKNKNIFVFTSFPDCADNAWALFIYMLKTRRGKEYVWLVDSVDESIAKLSILDFNGSIVKVVKKKSVKGALCFFRAAFVFSTHGLYTFYKKKSKHRIVVNLWHGMPIKNIGLLDGKPQCSYGALDFTLSTSNLFSQVMADSFGIPVTNVLKVGLPRNDFLHVVNCSQVKAYLNVPDDWRICVYMPTYKISITGDIRNDGDVGVFDLTSSCMKTISEQLACHKVVLVIKLHPMDVLNKHEFTKNEIGNSVLIKSDGFGEAGFGIYDVLAASSCLVTDYSSVCFDYMSLSKPIGFVIDGSYKRGLVEAVVNQKLPGVRIENGEDFVNFVLNGEVADNCNIFNEYRDANNSRRLLAALKI